MPTSTSVVSHILIKIDGNEMSQSLRPQLLEVIVEQHAYLPGMFTLRFSDQEFKLIDEGPFNPGVKIEILGSDEANKKFSLIKGEVTAVEPEYGEGMICQLLVRGYDQMHRLYRITKSKTYLNVKDSDIAKEIAKNAGLQTDIETTKTVYDHIFQNNQSDLNFLMQRAWRIGYECYVNAGKLIFRQPKVAEAKNTLIWGKDLLSFSPRMTLAEQVEEVMVTGWDIKKKAVIIGRAQKGQLYPTIKEKSSEWTSKLGAGSKTIYVEQSVVSQAEADILAAARLDEISGVFIEAEGVASRRPDIAAGATLKLDALGKRFSGVYLVTSATHIYTNTGMRTNFTVSGIRKGLLLDELSSYAQTERWHGVVPGLVTNSDDPQNMGRIKVKYPWMSEKEESDWMRIVSAGAGAKAGFCNIPAVDEEVLVAFVHGEFGQPVALGSLWNGTTPLPPVIDSAATGEKPKVHTWTARNGHHITIYENDKNRIELVTAGGHQANLDDKDKKIEIKSSGGLLIHLDDNAKTITIKSGDKIIINAANNIELSATNIKMEASSNLDMKGNSGAKLESGSMVDIKGATVKVGANVQLG